MLRSPEYGAIVVEHRDRLARFGSEYIEAALAASGRRLIVIEPDEVKDDLVQDMIDVLTSFCARLYGRRSARRRADVGNSFPCSRQRRLSACVAEIARKPKPPGFFCCFIYRYSSII